MVARSPRREASEPMSPSMVTALLRAVSSPEAIKPYLVMTAAYLSMLVHGKGKAVAILPVEKFSGTKRRLAPNSQPARADRQNVRLSLQTPDGSSVTPPTRPAGIAKSGSAAANPRRRRAAGSGTFTVGTAAQGIRATAIPAVRERMHPRPANSRNGREPVRRAAVSGIPDSKSASSVFGSLTCSSRNSLDVTCAPSGSTALDVGRCQDTGNAWHNAASDAGRGRKVAAADSAADTCHNR